MPFVLAHPAAVLPLRRFCPRFLSFPALVAGSLSLDAGYLPMPFHEDHFAHTFLGSFGFGLPMGLLLVGFFALVRSPVAARLPGHHRKTFLPISLQPLGSPLVILISVLIGAWTHFLLDATTHRNGWLVEQLPALQTVVVRVGGRSVRLCMVLWYAFSFLGVGWLCLAYGKWKANSNGARVKGLAPFRDALVVSLLFLGVAVIHHLFHGLLGNLVVALSSLFLVVGAVLKLGGRPPEEKSFH